MKGNTKQALIWASAIVVISVFVAWSVHIHSAPRVQINLAADVTPIPKIVATLNTSDIEKILGVEQFRVISNVDKIPAVIKKSFSNVTGQPFDLADPGEVISSDMIIPGKSSRRLVFLEVSNDSAILFYEQGGFVGTFNALFFGSETEGAHGKGTLERGPIPRDIDGIRAAFKMGKFHEWKARD